MFLQPFIREWADLAFYMGLLSGAAFGAVKLINMKRFGRGMARFEFSDKFIWLHRLFVPDDSTIET